MSTLKKMRERGISKELARRAAAGIERKQRLTAQGKAVLPEIENREGEKWLRANGNGGK